MRQLDVAGRALEEMETRGIRLDVLMAEFAQACVIPGVEAVVVEATEMSGLHGRLGYVPVGPAIRFSLTVIRLQQVALGIDPDQVELGFVMLDATLDSDGNWKPEYPRTIMDLDAFFERLAFIAGDIQAKSIVANAGHLEAAELAEPADAAFGAILNVIAGLGRSAIGFLGGAVKD